MRTTILLLLLLLHLTAQAAVPVGGVRINSDTTGTNTRSAAVTVTLQTNLNSGVVNATNSVRVGQAGEAGVVQISSTTSTNFFILTTTSTNALVSINATDDFDHAALTIIVTNEVTMADLLHLQNGTNVKVYIQYDGSILGRRLFAEDSPASSDYTRIQPTDFKINAGTNTNYFEVHLSNGEINWLHESTNAFKVVQDSGYLGGGTLALTDDGTYKAFGTSSLTINPTDNYLPYRSSSTTFGNSPFNVINGNTNFIGFNSTNKWLSVLTDISGNQGAHVGIGMNALDAQANGLFSGNYAFGKDALKVNTSGSSLVAMGEAAGRNTVSGSSLTYVGRRAGFTSTTASYDTAVGTEALFYNIGAEATALGFQAGITASNAQRSVIAGVQPLGTERNDKVITDTVWLGYKSSGTTNNTQTITNSILIGSHLNPDASNEIVIGGGATQMGANTVNLGNTNATTLYLGGRVVNRGDIGAACSDETTALTTGTNKVRFRMPYAMTVTAVRASLTTAQTAGSILTVDINEGGTSILSTKITIDDNETTSTTAATPPVISDTALADDAIITVDIDQVGTSPAGLKIWIIGVY